MAESRTCLIVEDQSDNRDWLKSAITAAFSGVTVVEAATLREARDAVLQAPWLVLVDLGLPDGCGVELIREIKAASPETLVVVATIYDDDQHLFDALSAGAGGYLLKGEPPELMTTYLRRLESGEPPLSPSIARRLLGYFQAPERVVAASEEVALTGRETETLTLLARGMTIAEVARSLALKPQTVAGYVKVIYQKLNVSSRAEATLKAVKRGLA